METWREMWIRCSEERDRKLKSLTHNLTEKFLTKAEPKRTTKIAYVDTAAKVPKSVARAQVREGQVESSGFINIYLSLLCHLDVWEKTL